MIAVPLKVRARAPLRLGLAGGGTDVSPYCDEHGGAVLNATIDLCVHVTLRRLVEPIVVLAADDRAERHVLPLAAALPLDGPLPLHRGVYNRIVSDFLGGTPLPVEMTTYSDAPAGSGLGSSSTLVVALIQGFVELLGLPLGEYDVARLAHEIERYDLGLAGGRQDPYAATFGGVNFIEFDAEERVVVNPLRIKPWILNELEASLLLYWTGVSRESARIIDEEQQRMRTGDALQLEALHTLKREAWTMKECVLRGDFGALAASMQRGWLAKTRIASAITTGPIERAITTALASGAFAAKVSGAGGGGFVILLVEPERRGEVWRALDALGSGRVRACRFTKHGTQGWRID